MYVKGIDLFEIDQSNDNFIVPDGSCDDVRRWYNALKT